MTELASQKEKWYRNFRKGERKQMIDTLHDPIEESGKPATSHYTPSKERVRRVKLTRQLIWKQRSCFEELGLRLAIEVQHLKKQLEENDDERKKALAPAFSPLREWEKPEPENGRVEKAGEPAPEKAEEQEQGLYPETEQSLLVRSFTVVMAYNLIS